MQEKYFIDFETHSETEDIKAVGLYKYVNTAIPFMLGVKHKGQLDVLDEKSIKEFKIPKGSTIVAHNIEFDWAFLEKTDPEWYKLEDFTLYCTQTAFKFLNHHKQSLAYGAQMLEIANKETFEGDLKVHEYISLKGGLSAVPEIWDEVSSYCKQDVEILEKLCDKLWPLFNPETHPSEHANLISHIKVNKEGIPIDIKEAARLEDTYLHLRAKETEACLALSEGEVKSTSCAVAARKYINETYDVDIQNTQPKSLTPLLKHKSLKLRALAKTIMYGANHGTKLKKLTQRTGVSEASNFIDLHCYKGAYSFLAADTHRFASYDFNFLNLPREEPTLPITNTKQIGAHFRGLIKAFRGRKLIVADFTAIELCVLLAFAKDYEKIDLLKSGGCVYSDFATRVYGYKINKKDHPVERTLGKVLTLSGGYGAGSKQLHSIATNNYGLDVSESFMANARVKYLQDNMKVQLFWKKMYTLAHASLKKGENEFFSYENETLHIKVPTPDGFSKLALRNVSVSKGGVLRKHTSSYGAIDCKGSREFTSVLCQATARVILSEKIKALQAEGLTVAMHCHDEIILHEKDTVSHKKISGQVVEHMTTRHAAEVMKTTINKPLDFVPDVLIRTDEPSILDSYQKI